MQDSNLLVSAVFWVLEMMNYLTSLVSEELTGG